MSWNDLLSRSYDVACNSMVSRAFVDVMAFNFVRTCSMTMAIDPITIMYLMYSDSDVMTICQDGTRPRLMAVFPIYIAVDAINEMACMPKRLCLCIKI